MSDLGEQIYKALIVEDRWKLYLNGLGTTLYITVLAIVLGVAIGTLVAVVKVNAADNPKLKWASVICEIYTTVIRGTPLVLQLLIMYFIILGGLPMNMVVYTAVLTFGINSGAYVSEIVRAGIQSIDRGQMEAGRSLGLSRSMTMRTIIFPQAIKNVLPALGNEFITLFKETSIVGYVAIMDLTRAADYIRSMTWQAFVPLIVAAGIYLGIVMLMAWGLGKIEKHLAMSDAR